MAAFTSGLGPLLGRWIEDDRIATPPEVAQILAVHLEHARDRAVRSARILERAAEALSGAGIECVGVVKGAHTGRRYFPEPGTRPASDLDLVVGPAAFDAAEESLAAAGFERLERQPRPRQSEWRPPGEPRELCSLELTHRDNPLTLDLHASLERDFFGVRTLDLGPVERVLEPWKEGPRGTGVPAQPALTAYLAAHASEGLHGLTLLRLVELVLVIRTDVPAGRLDWDALAAFLETRGGLRFVYPAFELVERLAPGTVDPAFHLRLADDAPRRMIRVLARIRPSGAQRADGVSLAERFMWARGPVEWIRRLLYMLRPRRIEGAAGLARIYAERLWRVVRGRIRLGRGP